MDPIVFFFGDGVVNTCEKNMLKVTYGENLSPINNLILGLAAGTSLQNPSRQSHFVNAVFFVYQVSGSTKSRPRVASSQFFIVPSLLPRVYPPPPQKKSNFVEVVGLVQLKL